eukprot:CAMPEP_0113703008 /NCGR_PEP_ID=MMETSP0038_2-20120614/25568_1 /TAXON_ID=2898 /ORGANISM="Cryptomonas paramecium" /LENGTH=466 /DNA_ID=CAMNT_0000627317 /DNA_START=35 /DNA_END=1432 /DNA_ORIENTATION=+ /assembly_acc=CAM_ASM_000170
MGNSPMMPMPPPPAEAEVEELLGSVPSVSNADDVLSFPVSVPSNRKIPSDAIDEDQHFVAKYGSPTSVVDFIDFHSKSGWINKQHLVGAAGGDKCMENASQAYSCHELAYRRSNIGDYFDLLTDDLVLQIMDGLDVKSAVLVFGPSSRRCRVLAREWFPWRCMDLRHWLSLPNHRAMIWEVYRKALDHSDEYIDKSHEDKQTRRIRLSNFLGNAGYYRQGEELLSSSLFEHASSETRADQLLGLAHIRWRAQQARHGGDEWFIWSIVVAALESVEIRRALPGLDHRRKLALTLEVLAENAACYGHCLLALAMEGREVEEATADGRRMPAPFDIAQGAARECVDVWASLGDDEKLADAWAASAAVDFYAGRDLEGALRKLALAQAMCAKSRRLVHPTHALVLFNLAYISLVAFGRAEEAAGLFARSLAVREAILGPQHPFTEATRSELLACLRLLREEEAAAERRPE